MSEEKKTRKKMSIMTKILIGFALGIIAGLIVGDSIRVIQPFGDLFLRLLRMLVVPLIFSSLVVGMASISDIKVMGRIGGRTLLMILLSTSLSVAIGLGLAFTIRPGIGVNLDLPAMSEVYVASPSVLQTFLNMVPINPVEALATGNMLQIIVFAIFLGIAIVVVGEPAKPVLNFLNGLAECMYRITDMVIKYAPIGVFALIAFVVGTQGAAVLLPLLLLVLTVYLGAFLIVMFVNCFFTVGLLARMNPFKMLKHFSPAMLFAFATASSAATLPVSLKCAQEKMGISRRVSSFVLPLGATVNMNGASLYHGVCVVFIAQLMGVDLSMTQLLTVILTAMLAAIGAAGVPGAGLIMLTMVLTSVGMPPEAIAIVAGVDRLLDSARTTPNVTGDVAIALAVARWEGELDEDIFYERKEFVAVAEAAE